MNYTVPTISIVFMAISILASVAIPAALYVFFRRKYGCAHISFWVGCAVMLVFAFILEQLVHSVILNSAAGAAIKANIWLYGAYGGLMAGLFEESGRLFAFSTLLKKQRGNDHNALMYGAGHGGCEVVCLLTFTMINNLIYSIMLNNGQAATLTAKLTDAQAASMETAFAQLSSTAPYMFLMGIVERGAAVIVQISLSVLVWFAVKEGGKKLWLYALAIVLHLVLDMASVVLNNYLPGAVIVTELIIWIVAIAYAFLARWVWKRNARPAPLMEANPSL